MFDGATFLRLLVTDTRGGDDMAESMTLVAREIFEAPPNRRRQEFMLYVAPYLWPKQYAGAFRWLYQMHLDATGGGEKK